MALAVRHQLLIAATAAAVFFTNLGVTRLWDQDEAFFARCAVEMHQRGEWVVPYFNGELFAHKPPLMFWLMRLGYLLFGVTELAARFWSAVFAVGTALLVYRMGRRLFNAEVGLWAGLAMCTALMFDIVARAATPDSYLVFFTTLALHLFVRQENWRDTAGSAELKLSWIAWASIYAVMGLAFLVKGPIGILLPGGTVGLYLLLRNSHGRLPSDATWGDRIWQFLRHFSPTRILCTIWKMRPLTALAAVILVAGPWFAPVGWKTGGKFLAEFFGVHNYGRFLSAMDSHSGPIWYYIPAVLVGFFPWSIFAVPTGIDLARSCRGMEPWQRPAKFVACWIVVQIGFFSLAGTKLPSYVLPAYPALALATACYLRRWLKQPETVHRWWPRLSFGSLLLVGVTMAVAAPLVANYEIQGQPLLEKLGVSSELRDDFMIVGWIGALLVAAGALGLVLSEIQRRRAALAGFAIAAPLFCLALLAGIAVRLDRHQPSPEVADIVRNHSEGPAHLAQFGYFRPSLVYYADTKLEECKTPQRVTEFLRRFPQSFVVTTDEHYDRLQFELPTDVTVLARRPEFPGRGTVVILGRPAEVARRK